MLGQAIDGPRFTRTKARAWRAEIWALANEVKPYVDTAGRERFACAVRNGLAARKWTRAQLAVHVDCSASRISKIVCASADVTPKERRAILRALDTE